ncbi:MAG TPA: hypothetical protein VK930_00935 [Verrucomicrobiae bacterium]|nr:hypothetical protein [Verrucomicrobiae bacterium]
MPRADIWELNGVRPSARGCREFENGYTRPSRVSCVARIMLLAVGAYLSSGVAIKAQTSDSQSDIASRPWTRTADLQGGSANPTRTVESHTQSGNRAVDSESIQRRGADGDFEPYQDIEKSTVQVDSATVRTMTRTFGRDADGARTLVQVTEEERHTRASGDSSVVRSTSNPDADGNLQVVQREVEETKKTGKDVEETKTTVMLPGPDGALAPAMMVQERRQLGANDTVASQKTTLLPDLNGSWQVSEVRQAATRQDGKNRSTEERVSRPDADGKLNEVSRTVRRESEGSGEKSGTVERYSVDVPGAARDEGLHLVERSTTTQRTSATGQQATGRQVEQPDPGDPGGGLRVTVITSDSVRPGASGAQATETIQMRDANGSFEVVSVDTSKSDNVHAIQVQIAPSEKPK